MTDLYGWVKNASFLIFGVFRPLGLRSDIWGEKEWCHQIRHTKIFHNLCTLLFFKKHLMPFLGQFKLKNWPSLLSRVTATKIETKWLKPSQLYIWKCYCMLNDIHLFTDLQMRKYSWMVNFVFSPMNFVGTVNNVVLLWRRHYRDAAWDLIDPEEPIRSWDSSQ